MFEYDPNKSLSNFKKHGIDFEKAQQLWNGATASFHLPHTEESRMLVVGQIGEQFWSAIITLRNENIRIISVRRSRQNEKEIWQLHHQP